MLTTNNGTIFTGMFWKDTAERVIGTFAQGWLGAIVGGNIFDVTALGWKQSLGIGATAGLIALLKCVVAGTIGQSSSPSFVTTDYDPKHDK
jgi:r1t holin